MPDKNPTEAAWDISRAWLQVVIERANLAGAMYDDDWPMYTTLDANLKILAGEYDDG